MNNRERFLATMEYESVDRVPNHELGVWGQTVDRWQEEGLDISQLHWDWFRGEEYFGMDYREFVPINFGMIPPFPEEVLEETDRYQIKRHASGIVTRALKKGTARGTRASMDQYLEFPVKTRGDFERLKKRYPINHKQRYPDSWEEKVEEWQDRDHVLILGANCQAGGFYWRARDWMGTENLSLAFYDQPELIGDMMGFYADFIMAVAEPMLKRVDFDYFNFNEDLSMKGGPLISPELYRRFIFPHRRRMITFFKEHGVRYVALDTDGNCEALIPLFMEEGVDILWPLERASDMDPLRIRKEYGSQLRLWGGVDKRVLSGTREEIRSHLRALQPLIEEGGYIPTVDHTVPPDVPLDNFQYYMKLKQELLDVRG